MQNRVTQVILLEKQGYMYSVWLPNKCEGKYKFPKNERGIVPPITIVGCNGQWIVEATGKVYKNTQEIIGMRCIDEQSDITVVTKYSQFEMYMECSDRDDRKYIPYHFEDKEKIVNSNKKTKDLLHTIVDVPEEIVE